MGCRAWVVACTTSAVAAGLIAGTAPAQAGVRTQPIGQHCWGPSPHILDIPFYGGASVRTDARRPGVFAVWGHSASLSSYPVDTWVTITHLPTGHTETFHRRWSARLADRPMAIPGHDPENALISPAAFGHGCPPDDRCKGKRLTAFAPPVRPALACSKGRAGPNRFSAGPLPVSPGPPVRLRPVFEK